MTFLIRLKVVTDGVPTPLEDSTQLWIWNSRNTLKMIISNEVETLQYITELGWFVSSSE